MSTDSCQTVEFWASSRAVPLGLQQLWSYPCYVISLLGRSVTLSPACTHPPPECAALPFTKHLNASFWRIHYVLFIRSGENKWIPHNQLSVLWVKSLNPPGDIRATLESFPWENSPLFFILLCFTEGFWKPHSPQKFTVWLGKTEVSSCQIAGAAD